MNIEPMPQRAPYEVSPRRYAVSHQMATTAFELPNFRTAQSLGVVRGIVVRSRNGSRPSAHRSRRWWVATSRSGQICAKKHAPTRST
jgi:hypothetical protein